MSGGDFVHPKIGGAFVRGNLSWTRSREVGRTATAMERLENLSDEVTEW